MDEQLQALADGLERPRKRRRRVPGLKRKPLERMLERGRLLESNAGGVSAPRKGGPAGGRPVVGSPEAMRRRRGGPAGGRPVITEEQMEALLGGKGSAGGRPVARAAGVGAGIGGVAGYLRPTPRRFRMRRRRDRPQRA